jgi:YD repeat-containing protein
MYQNGRNTYYWDKHTYAVAAGDYTKARIKHWTHLSTNTGVTADSIESIKYPFERRIWRNYPGQATDPTGLGTAISGTLDKPIIIARVLDDGSTQLTRFAYNNLGQVTDAIDAVGRETQITYAANGIDPVTVQQKTSPGGFSTIGQFTYNSQHLPLTYTDAAGQTTAFTYNLAGQLTQVTNALGETTGYQFDSLGYLTKIINANGQTQSTLTRDAYGRIATATDYEGYTVSCAYDSFDRITMETFPDGTTRKYAYSNLDLASVTDRQGKVTQYAHDAVRNLT